MSCQWFFFFMNFHEYIFFPFRRYICIKFYSRAIVYSAARRARFLIAQRPLRSVALAIVVKINEHVDAYDNNTIKVNIIYCKAPRPSNNNNNTYNRKPVKLEIACKSTRIDNNARLYYYSRDGISKFLHTCGFFPPIHANV